MSSAKWILSLALVAALSVSAGAEWVNLGGGPGTPPEVTVLSDGDGETTIKVQIYGFDLATTIIEDTRFSVISLPEEPRLKWRGYPALPHVTRSVIVPDMAHMNVEVVKKEVTEMTIDPVISSRGIIWRTEDPDTVSYSFSDLYEKGGVFPEVPSALGTPYILRDFRGTAVTIYPFSHDPVSGLLRVRTSVTVRVYEDGAGTINVKTRPRSGKSDPSFISMYENHFLNYPGGGDRNRLLTEAGQMLIIAADNFVNDYWLNEFIDWKKRRGH